MKGEEYPRQPRTPPALSLVSISPVDDQEQRTEGQSVANRPLSTVYHFTWLVSLQIGKHAHGVLLISRPITQETTWVPLVRVLAPHALQATLREDSFRSWCLAHGKEDAPIVCVYGKVQVLALLDRNLSNEVAFRRRDGRRQRDDIVLACHAR